MSNLVLINQAPLDQHTAHNHIVYHQLVDIPPAMFLHQQQFDEQNDSFKVNLHYKMKQLGSLMAFK